MASGFLSCSFLGRNDIKKLLDQRELIIEPLLTEEQITTVGVDLRLDSRFRRFRELRHGTLDTSEEVSEELYEFIETKIVYERTADGKHFLEIEPIVLQPHEFILGQTFEYIVLPTNLIGFLDGRSSYARRGLIVHATAGSIEPGFQGRITLELGNIGKIPLKIYPLTRIVNLHLAMIPPTEKYSGLFQFQVRMKPPKPDPDLLILLGKTT